MADAVINVQIDTSALVLDYEPAAHDQLTTIDPAARASWDAAIAAVGPMSLDPLFASVSKEALADLIDAGRLLGNDPPDLMSWFQVVCDEAAADAVLAALQGLPFVAQAVRRSVTKVAAVVTWATNPETVREIQIEPGVTGGIDAKFAWQVDGGIGQRTVLVDIESGWDLTHEDLATASITKAPAPFETDIDHGTAVAGILVSPDNGKGIVGIVPAAALVLVNTLRPDGAQNNADAIVFGASLLGASSGRVLLAELEETSPGPGVPVENDPAVLQAIQFATSLGITVIEPAGNGPVDLDNTPSLFQMSPRNPAFIDSGAVVVGAAEIALDATPQRAAKSTFGDRVDCFALGFGLRAPSSAAPNAYQNFTGTSGASAVIAGAAAALQAMAFAHTGGFLSPNDVRNTFRNAALCTTIGAGKPAGIGGMPDLRKIAAQFGFARILPPALVPTVQDGLFLAAIDAEDHLFRQRFVTGTGWESADTDSSFVFGGQSAGLTMTPDGAGGSTTDAFVVSIDGTVHHQFWDASGAALGDLTVARTGSGAVTPDRALAAVRTDGAQVKVLGVNGDGALVALSGDGATHLAAGFDPPLVIDGVNPYRTTAGASIVSRTSGTADAVAVTDVGTLSFLSFSQLALVGTGWTPPAPIPSPVPLDPRVQPGLAGNDSALAVLAVGTDGQLLSAALSPAAVVPLTPVDASAPVARLGPVALVLVGADLLVALAVGVEGLLRFSTRRLSDPVWAPLSVLDFNVAVSPLGGVVATRVGLNGAAAVCSRIDGRLMFTSFTPASGFDPLRLVEPN
ncbi:MAG TPA: S8 family serine peptidase [Solirubrobacteraceae bacterium]|nr:S8 family serine peptidase [Solirubrobacteraceae bacterium]